MWIVRVVTVILVHRQVTWQCLSRSVDGSAPLKHVLNNKLNAMRKGARGVSHPDNNISHITDLQVSGPQRKPAAEAEALIILGLGIGEGTQCARVPPILCVILSLTSADNTHHPEFVGVW